MTNAYSTAFHSMIFLNRNLELIGWCKDLLDFKYKAYLYSTWKASIKIEIFNDVLLNPQFILS